MPMEACYAEQLKSSVADMMNTDNCQHTTGYPGGHEVVVVVGGWVYG